MMNFRNVLLAAFLTAAAAAQGGTVSFDNAGNVGDVGSSVSSDFWSEFGSTGISQYGSGYGTLDMAFQANSSSSNPSPPPGFGGVGGASGGSSSSSGSSGYALSGVSTSAGHNGFVSDLNFAEGATSAAMTLTASAQTMYDGSYGLYAYAVAENIKTGDTTYLYNNIGSREWMDGGETRTFLFSATDDLQIKSVRLMGYADGISVDTMSITSSSAHATPVPAALPLIIAGLGIAGFVKKRRTKQLAD